MTSATTKREQWKEVTAAEPCPICEKPGWCRRSPDGTKIACRREARGAVETKRYRDGSEAYLHVLRDAGPAPGNGKPKRQRQPSGLTPTASDAPFVQHSPAPAGDGQDTMAKRDAAYRRLLALLSLSPDHRENLRQRGLSDADIDASEYRTLPRNGRQAVVKELVAELGQDFSMVPGMVMTDGRPRIAAPSGLLVPARDLAGRVVALKLRADKPADGRNKYCYLSSAKYGGPSPGSPAHVPIGVCGPVEVARITEGELKADVATRLSGVPTVSFPGVSSWLAVLPVLQALGATTVKVAFDADAAEKPNVARPLRECVKELQALGYAVELERWPADAGKGIDDVYAAGCRADIEILAGRAALEAAKKIAAAAGVDDESPTSSADASEGDKKKSQSTLLVELAQGAELWHAPGDGDAYASVRIVPVDCGGGDDAGDDDDIDAAEQPSDDGPVAHWPVRSKAFRRWLAREFFLSHGKAPGSQALQDALTVIEGQAAFAGQERPVFVRVAGHDGRLYLDLANAAWQAVEIDAGGWRVIESEACPVRFRRAKAMMPLPTPTVGGNIGELRRFVNVDPDGWPLLLGWLAAALNPNGPYPVLALHGEQGSAKTCTGLAVQKILDPNKNRMLQAKATERRQPTPAPVIYADSLLRASVVVDAGGELWLCPRRPGGWSSRQRMTMTNTARSQRLRPESDVTMEWLGIEITQDER